MGAGPWTQDTALLLAALGCTDRESWGGVGTTTPAHSLSRVDEEHRRFARMFTC